MTGNAPPRRFTHHALAVLAAAMLGATLFEVLWTTMLGIHAGVRSPGPTWLAMLAMLCWLSTFAITLPSAAIVFSLLWPVTRRRTVAAGWICLVAGAATGILLAPLASPQLQGTTLLQLLTFALIGAGVAALYRVLLHRLGRSS
ncbi:hypothetical protein [uncultured Sphingomonas sp.]|uniref:hypothetical protein n=1 Tax=uncultured Sphingomonas sp. TaxID=158754 RepID=UPI0025F490F6|nr:hypothetical protein [uncultured Sphingomonas sp.]